MFYKPLSSKNSLVLPSCVRGPPTSAFWCSLPSAHPVLLGHRSHWGSTSEPPMPQAELCEPSPAVLHRRSPRPCWSGSATLPTRCTCVRSEGDLALPPAACQHKAEGLTRVTCRWRFSQGRVHNGPSGPVSWGANLKDAPKPVQVSKTLKTERPTHVTRSEGRGALWERRCQEEQRRQTPFGSQNLIFSKIWRTWEFSTAYW